LRELHIDRQYRPSYLSLWRQTIRRSIYPCEPMSKIMSVCHFHTTACNTQDCLLAEGILSANRTHREPTCFSHVTLIMTR